MLLRSIRLFCSRTKSQQAVIRLPSLKTPDAFVELKNRSTIEFLKKMAVHKDFEMDGCAKMSMEEIDRTYVSKVLRRVDTYPQKVIQRMLSLMPLHDQDWTKWEKLNIFYALVYCKQQENAMDILKRLGEWSMDGTELINMVMEKLSENGQTNAMEKALQAWREVNGPVDATTYGHVIMACSKGSKADARSAIDYFDEMVDLGLTPSRTCYTGLIVSAARTQNWDLASNLLENTSNLDEDEKSYFYWKAISDCGEAHQGVYALRIFKHALSHEVPLTLGMYNAVIKACSDSGRFVEAERVYETLKKSPKVYPSFVTYLLMISTYGRALMPDKAMEVYHEMKRYKKPEKIAMVNALLYSFALSRQHDRALQFLNHIKRKKIAPDIFTNHTMIYSAGKVSNVQSAEQFFNAIPEFNPNQPDTLRRGSISYENMMEAYFNAGKYENVLDMWRNDRLCQRRAKTSKVLHFLLQACHRLGNSDEALQLMTDFQQRGLKPRVSMYNFILDALLLGDDILKAWSFVDSYDRNKVTPNAFTIVSLMEGIKNSKSILSQDEMEDTQLRHNEVKSLFDRYLYIHNSRRSFVSENLGPPPYSMIFILALESALDAKDFTFIIEVFRIFQEEIDAGNVFDPTVVRVVYRHMIYAEEFHENWKQCVELYDSMIHSSIGHDNLAYQATLRCVANAGQTEAALEYNNGEWYRNHRDDA